MNNTSLQFLVDSAEGAVVNYGADKCSVTFDSNCDANKVKEKLKQWTKKKAIQFPASSYSLNPVKRATRAPVQQGEIIRYVLNGFSCSKSVFVSQYVDNSLDSGSKLKWKLDFNGSLTAYDKYMTRKRMKALFGNNVLEEIWETGRVTLAEEFIDVVGLETDDIVVSAPYFKVNGYYVTQDAFVSNYYIGELGYKIYNKHLEMQDRRRKYHKEKIGHPLRKLLRLEYRHAPSCSLKHFRQHAKNPFEKLACYELRALRANREWDIGYDGTLMLFGVEGFLSRYIDNGDTDIAHRLETLLAAARFDALTDQLTRNKRKRLLSAFDFLKPSAKQYQRKPTKPIDYYRHYGFVNAWFLRLAAPAGSFNSAQYGLLGIAPEFEPQDLLQLPIRLGLARRVIEKATEQRL